MDWNNEMTNAGRFATQAIHAGQAFDPRTGAVTPPIYTSSTFVQDGIGGLRDGYEYARGGNPTRDALQVQLAALEGGASALSFASGLAAEDALLRAVLRPGDHVIVGNDVYGGTHRLIRRIFGEWGVTHSTVDTSNLDLVRDAISPATKVLWIETPSNPLMTVSDLAALAELGHARGLIVVADNTFASPALQQPLRFGVDVVVHSTTKYLGGHSDLIGGAVIFAEGREELAEQVRFIQYAAGAVSSPFDAYLTTRGVKTLAVRMRAHSENALAIAEALDADSRVRSVRYPGLTSHPGHALAAQQMSAFGGMVSIELHSEAQARRFAESTTLFQLAESLGGVESLVNYPADMTHASVRGTPAEVPPTIVRLSVGIEDVDDLLDDVRAALDRLAD